MNPPTSNLEWKPHQGPQEYFHSAWAYEVFYGGAAGGGKSESLLIEATRYVHVPGYTAIIFRRTYPELRQARGLIARSKLYFPLLGGSYNQSTFVWTFPSGATIQFGQLEHEDNKYDHKSAEYAYIGFDELTSFTEEQYLYLFSRLRTTAIDPTTGQAVPVRIRAASNPGDQGHEWVKARFIDQLKPYNVKYFIRVDDEDIPCSSTTKNALSRQFIPANLYDNPTLLRTNPGYEAQLMALSLLERERLLSGNWDILVAGNVFKAEWFKYIKPTDLPQNIKWYRGWDLATSIKTKADWTASANVGIDKQANVYIRDMYRQKKVWPKIKAAIKEHIALEDDVKRTLIEAKQHGLAAVQEFQTDPELAGRRIDAVNVDTDKLSRALVWSARAENGKVFLVEGPWTAGFVSRASLFDGEGTAPDDEIDAVSLVMQEVAIPVFKKIKFLAIGNPTPPEGEQQAQQVQPAQIPVTGLLAGLMRRLQ